MFSLFVCGSCLEIKILHMCLNSQVNGDVKSFTGIKIFNLNVYVLFLNKMHLERNTFNLIFLKLGNYISNLQNAFINND
jgi:hypothetical protein